jgi:hypothetical protein
LISQLFFFVMVITSVKCEYTIHSCAQRLPFVALTTVMLLLPESIVTSIIHQVFGIFITLDPLLAWKIK